VTSVGILGAGPWGTALAIVGARAGRSVTLWARNPDTVTTINQRHENPAHLPEIALDPAIVATSEISAAASADIVILAVPAQTVRAIAAAASVHIRRRASVMSAAKGLERGSRKRMTEIVAEVIPEARAAVLSGPSFAGDVARGLPTAVTIAANEEAHALDLCHAIGSSAFRPYAETDVRGVEIGGAVKNVLAIAVGIVAGRMLGESASAALVARGFAELRRLAEAYGAEPHTLMGLSGLGDLVLTCSSRQSRNFSYGLAIGTGRTAPVTQSGVIEGIETAAVARELAQTLRIETPIIEAVAAIVEGSLSVDAAIDGLMARPLKRETD
jgi:glycerol-3-phosphate dehydrogenase (NAD(P)+)